MLHNKHFNSPETLFFPKQWLNSAGTSSMYLKWELFWVVCIFFLYRTPNLMIKAPSPLFLCGYLVRVSEASPRQRTCVPAQHAVTQRLQVTASRRSWSQNTHAQTHTSVFQINPDTSTLQSFPQMCISPCFFSQSSERAFYTKGYHNQLHKKKESNPSSCEACVCLCRQMDCGRSAGVPHGLW